MDNTINYKLKKPTPEDWYNIQDHNDNMDIVDAELKKLNDGKAPSGHGLGKRAEGQTMDFKTALQLGGGFYHIGNATDSPLGRGDWLSLIQTARMIAEGDETGAQLVFYDFDRNQPKMWFRTLLSGNVSDWFEMLHTGNLSTLNISKFSCGSRAGTNKYGENNPTILTFDFVPRALIMSYSVNGNARKLLLWIEGMSAFHALSTNESIYSPTVKRDGNVISWYANNEAAQLNDYGSNLWFMAIG